MEKSIPVPDRETATKLLGPFDRHVRRVRDATGAELYLKDDRLRIRGTREAVERAYQIFLKLADLLHGRDEIRDEDLDDVLGADGHAAPDRRQAFPGAIFRRGMSVEAKSLGQGAYLHEIDANEIVFSIGPAGTGKTFLAVAKAVEAMKAKRVRRLVLVRPAVEAGERLGFLPGDIQAKVNPYLRPIYDSLNAFLEFGQLQRLIDHDIVEIVPLAYMRGRTLDEAFVILDEAQNTTSDQMMMFLTRMGRGSKIVVTGDITQIDLPEGRVSGLVEVQQVLDGISGIKFVYLTTADIVRHALVQKVVDAYGRHRPRNPNERNGRNRPA